VTEALGKVRLAKLTPARVDRFLSGLAGDGLSGSTIADTLTFLRAAIRYAQRDGLVARNVAMLANMPAMPKPDDPEPGMPGPGAFFTVEQIGPLIAGAADDPWWNAYVHIAIMCGLRPGELLGLRWADLPGDVLQVRHSLKVTGLAALKTRQSRRALELPSAVTTALRARKVSQAQQRLEIGPAWHEHDLVFPGRDGEPCSRHRAEHGFRKLCERAGLGKGWTRYACRHTFCTVLSHGGTDIEAIADAMGHVNSNVTRTVYRHALDVPISSAATAFDKIMRA
jgi:integrase